jgi:hypothetical protein
MSNLADDIIIKDPHVSRNYTVPWSAIIGSATIATSTWLVPPGITADSNSFDDNTSTVRLGGGTEGSTYEVRNTITTSDGQTLDYHIEVRVRVIVVDFASNVGKVRAIVGDTDPGNLFMKDAEIETLLSISGDSIERAAVFTLRAMATKHINILKDAVTLDIETRASNMARELNKLADAIEKRLAESGEDQAFDFIEMVDDDFSLREKILKSEFLW